MQIGEVVRFQEGQFFNGAVQLGWVQDHPDLAQKVARSFVFHGPRYHGGAGAEQEGIEGAYRLKDTASFLRDLLGSMQAAECGQETNPYWLAVAGYGSGKSHLSVAIAEMLAAPDGATAAQVLEQVRNADADIGANLGERLAALGKPVLVLPLDGSRRFHLGVALSRVVFTQLDRAGVNADAIRALSPRFLTAEQFVERNFAFRTEVFSAALPGRDAAAVCAALRNQDEDVFDAVNVVYTEANGHSIPIDGQESAQELIETLGKVYCADDGPFSHVLVLFDELGLYLEHAAEHPERAGARVLQELFQGVQDNSSKAHFVGFIQYELKSYLKRFGSSDLKHLQRYVTRFDGAEKWYLSTNLETLFAHMVCKDEAALAALWQEANPTDQGRQTWQRLSMVLPGFNRVSLWSEQEPFARVIHRGCWPLHPLAVWFLTRQRDLVQQRSALAFVKDVVERLRGQPALDGVRLRQVSAADLVLDYMLPELEAAERDGSGTVAETLRTLLDRHEAHLDRPQRLVLAGIAVLEKTHVGRQPRDTVEALLEEATTQDLGTVREALSALSTLGAAEWNGDLQRYELLSDGASRGQFEHWLRTQRRVMSADDVRQLFVRRGVADCPIGDVRPDFDQRHNIRTQDWYFEARPAHLGIVENVVRQAFDEWRKATLPTEAKGKLIYLYLHQDDDILDADQRVQGCLDAELRPSGVDRAPVWVVYVTDRLGRIAEHLVRLAILDEKASTAEQDSFRRFIPEEQQRSRSALKEAVEDALKEKRFRVAGFTEPPAQRLGVTAREIFAAVYPQVVPFPFDGFSTTNGGGAKDAAQVAKALMADSVNYAWVQAQPVKLSNRVKTLLVQSWQALSDNGKPRTPMAPQVLALYRSVELAHQEDPSRTLLDSYRAIIAPPYGLNASSAAILMGLLLGSRSPQRAIECAGQQIPPAEWIEQAFSRKPGRQSFFDEVALGKAVLRSFDGDSEARWREFLDVWDAEERYDLMLQRARQAEERRAVDPVPPNLNLDYMRLKSAADQAAVNWTKTQHDLSRLQDEIERALGKANVHQALKYGVKALETAREMQASAHWPPKLTKDFGMHAEFAKELVAREIEGWIPRQICHSVQRVSEFRQATEAEADWLVALGFGTRGEQLTKQAQRSIARVEELQRHTLTLAKCEDYPRQPSPTASTLVLALRNEIRQGEQLIDAVQLISSNTLSADEKAAHGRAIKRRQAQLQDAITQRQAELGKLYELKLDSEEALREAAATVERLRQIFAGMPDEADINELAMQLQRIIADVAAWEVGQVSVERLAEILEHQAGHQLSELRGWLEHEDIEPPAQWDLDAIYRSLVAAHVETARRRSADWLGPRLVYCNRIAGLDRAACAAMEGELAHAPAYLGESDRLAASQLLEAVRRRLAELEEVERAVRIASWQRPYLALGDISGLDRRTCEALLRTLDQPPCPLQPVELAWQQNTSSRLTTHLDQLGIDDLVARIESLSQSMRRALFERLSRLMAG